MKATPINHAKEHADLRQYLDYQINIDQIEGKTLLLYHKYQSKIRQGGITDRTQRILRSVVLFVLNIS